MVRPKRKPKRAHVLVWFIFFVMVLMVEPKPKPKAIGPVCTNVPVAKKGGKTM